MEIAARDRSRSGTHSVAAARLGWGPTPRSNRSYTAGRRDGRTLTVLRTVTHVLTSLASIVFIVVAVYAGMTLYRINGSVDRTSPTVTMTP